LLVEVIALSSVAVLSAAASLVLWTLIPMAFGWSSSVVLTGSMEPAIDAGDVVVCAPISPDQLVPGYVIRFRDPAQPERHLLHRVVKLNDDGTLVSKGDANHSPDSTPVPPEAVDGMARLRVPWVGLPTLWWQNHQYAELSMFLITVLLMCAVIPYGWDPARPAPPEVEDLEAVDDSGLEGEPGDDDPAFVDVGDGIDGDAPTEVLDLSDQVTAGR